MSYEIQTSFLKALRKSVINCLKPRKSIKISIILISLTLFNSYSVSLTQVQLGEFLWLADYNPLGESNYAKIVLDDVGIPIVIYHDSKLGKQYNPATIAQWGLAEHARYFKTKNTQYLTSAMKSGQWLINNQTEEGTWLYNFSIDRKIGNLRELKAGWVSALTQGNAISLLVRLYQASENSAYLGSARKALKPFFRSIATGGVQIHISNTESWYEEWTHKDANLYTLNGHLFALHGLYDLFEVIHDSRALSLFLRGEKGLRKLLEQFNVQNVLPFGSSKPVKNWSTYDLQHVFLQGIPPHLVNQYYLQKLHIPSLKYIFEKTQYLPYQQMADLWQTELKM